MIWPDATEECCGDPLRRCEKRNGRNCNECTPPNGIGSIYDRSYSLNKQKGFLRKQNGRPVWTTAHDFDMLSTTVHQKELEHLGKARVNRLEITHDQEDIQNTKVTQERLSEHRFSNKAAMLWTGIMIAVEKALKQPHEKPMRLPVSATHKMRLKSGGRKRPTRRGRAKVNEGVVAHG